MNKPKISIVTVCLNCEKVIRETILSVVEQTYQNVEYIVIDGDSTDHTKSIIAEYTNRIHKYISEPDKGIFDAMNKGIKMATGDYIIFMNAGDTFASSTILEQIYPDLKEDIMYGGFAIHQHNKIITVQPDPFFRKKGIVKTMGICHQSIFVKVSLAKSHLFNTHYKLTADYNMIYSLWKEGYRFHEVNIPICIFDTNGVALNNFALQLKEVGQIIGKERSIIYSIACLYLRSKRNIKTLIKHLIY